MADLDDFFAKKDRKKSKSTKKYTTTEEIAKKLEDTAKKTEKLKKERFNDGEVNANNEQKKIACHIFNVCFITWAQDEWRDFEEEKKDYSGLKIGNLTVTANSENTTNASSKENTHDQDEEEEESGQETETKAPGPWKSINVTSEAVVDVPVETVEEAVPDHANVKSGRYLPPSMRFAGQAPAQSRSTNRSKAAPDIHNEEYFPTLSKNEPRKGRSEGHFELVQSNRSTSHRQAEQNKISTNQGPKLSLGNRYNGLSNDSW
ncbi:unnamed protein product [Phyllotreta striolata]|uniref:CDV3-like protein n=1 Tax=Phyllotreta striolata TaxID=444603 RepID=A0A9N9XP38_PHYSR|nr:unnamed protein product [Phyllotreta striolata]